MTKKLRYCFLLALLLHLLLLLSFSISIILTRNFEKYYQPYDESLKKKDFTVLPAYIYQSSQETPIKKPSPTQELTQKYTQEINTDKKIETSINGTEKPVQENMQQAQAVSQQTPKAQLKQKPNESSTAEKNSQDPLLKLLYMATAEHLVYPSVAQDFRVAGTVRVRFLVYPDGHLANITLIKSSGMGYYDDAVIAAVNAMSPVRNVNLYISKPKYVVAVIVFG